MASLSSVGSMIPRAHHRLHVVGFLSSCLLVLLLVGAATAAPSKASSAKISAHLTKTSFKSSEAGSVKLIYKFSTPSKSFAYTLTFKKGSKWQSVKSVKKTGSFKGSKSMTVKKVFAGKAVKIGSYRLKLSADGGSKTLSFKVIEENQVATSDVQVVQKLDLPELARTTGKPLLVEVGNPDWSIGRTALAEAQRTAAKAAKTQQIATVFLFCVRTKKQLALVGSAGLPVPVLADTSPNCVRDVNASAAVNLREADALTGRLFLPDGTLTRLDYEWEIPLRKLGIDPTAKSSAWMNLPVGDASYDITSLYAATVPVPDPNLVRGIDCSHLPVVDKVQPTCNVTAALDALRAEGKPLVVVGFAQYCPTCQKSTTEETYQAWADRHPDYTVVVITPDDPTTAWLWARNRGWNFLILANGTTALKGGSSDFHGFFQDVYKPLGLSWWGDHVGGNIPGDPFPSGF